MGHFPRAPTGYLAEAVFCVSERVPDKPDRGRAQDAACSNTKLDEYQIESLQDKGRKLAREWKSRQQ